MLGALPPESARGVASRGLGPVLGTDDLTLFRQFNAPVDRARGLSKNRAMDRPVAARNRPAATVKEVEPNTFSSRLRCKLSLDLLESGTSRQVATILHEIGIAEHHLLAHTPRLQR